MPIRWVRTLVGSVLAVVGCLGSTIVVAQTLTDAGVGFVLQSTDFGNPCTDDEGDMPRIYDNASANPVDISFKIINTGGSNLFIGGFGFVIPPAGPSRRPRVIRVTVPPGSSLGIRGQTASCAWIAIIRPH